MKRIVKYGNDGKPVFEKVTWAGHSGSCAKCSRVDTERSGTFALCCAEGGPLLAEYLVDKMRPYYKERERKVREWAKTAGVFKGV